MRKHLSMVLPMILVASLLVLAGCVPFDSPRAELKPIAEDFTRRLRWADYKGAARHLATRHQEAFQREIIGHGDDLKVVDVRFEDDGFPDSDGRKPMELVLDYYLLPSTAIKTARVALEWIYLDYGWSRPGVWLIDSDFPPLQ